MIPKPRWERLISMVVFMLILLFIFSAVGPSSLTSAQTPAACAQVIASVTKNLSTACKTLGADQICYGNPMVTVEYKTDSQISFGKAGDVIGFDAARAVTTSPLRLEDSSWGVAVMKLYVNVLSNPPTVQPITLILYGGANLIDITAPAPQTPEATNTPTTACTATVTRETYMRARPANNEQAGPLLAVNESITVTKRTADSRWVFAEAQGTKGWVLAAYLKLNCDVKSLPAEAATPPPPTRATLQAFYLSTETSADGSCTGIPVGGLLVQTPANRRVTFEINGVQVTLASTAIFRAAPRDVLRIDVLEGQATVAARGGQQTINAGQEATVPLGALTALDASGPPSAPYSIGDKLPELATLCKVGQSIGLRVPCDTKPTAVPVVRNTRRPVTSVPGAGGGSQGGGTQGGGGGTGGTTGGGGSGTTGGGTGGTQGGGGNTPAPPPPGPSDTPVPPPPPPEPTNPPPACLQAGASCTSGSQCCSGGCVLGKCAHEQ